MWKRIFRRFIAAAFLVFLLAEWGSHSVAFAHAYEGEGDAVYSEESGHEDPCKTLIRCSDGPSENRPVPLIGHDLSQHNALFDHHYKTRRRGGTYKDPRIIRSKISGLSRTLNPPFHPPELS